MLIKAAPMVSGLLVVCSSGTQWWNPEEANCDIGDPLAEKAAKDERCGADRGAMPEHCPSFHLPPCFFLAGIHGLRIGGQAFADDPAWLTQHCT